MTHQIYTAQQLQLLSLRELKTIYLHIGATVEVADKRRKSDWINAIAATQSAKVEKLSGGFRQIESEQAAAQLELETHLEQQAEAISPDDERLLNGQQGYQDAIALLPMQSKDHCYRMGYERGLRDVSPIPEDAGSQAIVFDKIGSTIYGGVWEAFVNNVLIRIAAVRGGYKTNLTDDALLIDFGIAVKESLLAVARIAPKENPTLEVFATDEPEVYAVYSHKPNQPSLRYEVDLKANSCTCPHYYHRHEQEGFKDKHIEAVRLALQVHTSLRLEKEMLLDKPFDELTDGDWRILNQLVAA
ncbi:hypothetical protein LC593_10870 [Nostoc sp. CHAB 5844]|nr:hypothetical protein [Nostoc sp. CHAB 5844]